MLDGTRSHGAGESHLILHVVQLCTSYTRTLQQLVSCQHDMGQLGGAKSLAVFTRRDCLCRCRFIETLLTCSVAHLKIRMSTKFSCSTEDKLISGTNKLFLKTIYL